MRSLALCACLALLCAALTDAIPAKNRSGRHGRPGRRDRGDPKPFHVCKIESIDDTGDGGKKLLDLGCPAECPLVERDIVWEQAPAKASYCQRRPKRNSMYGISACKITSVDGSYVNLDMMCPEECLEQTDTQITWEETAASLHVCKPNVPDQDEQAASEDSERPRRKGGRGAARRAKKHGPPAGRPCKITGADGYMYLNLDCPSNCTMKESEVTWEGVSATAHFCARQAPAKSRPGGRGGNRQEGEGGRRKGRKQKGQGRRTEETEDESSPAEAGGRRGRGGRKQKGQGRRQEVVEAESSPAESEVSRGGRQGEGRQGRRRGQGEGRRQGGRRRENTEETEEETSSSSKWFFWW